MGPLENDWIQMANEKRQAQTGPEDQRVTATHPFLSPLYLLKNQTRRPRIFQPSANVSFGNRKNRSTSIEHKIKLVKLYQAVKTDDNRLKHPKLIFLHFQS